MPISAPGSFSSDQVKVSSGDVRAADLNGLACIFPAAKAVGARNGIVGGLRSDLARCLAALAVVPVAEVLELAISVACQARLRAPRPVAVRADAQACLVDHRHRLPCPLFRVVCHLRQDAVLQVLRHRPSLNCGIVGDAHGDMAIRGVQVAFVAHRLVQVVARIGGRAELRDVQSETASSSDQTGAPSL